MSCEPATSGQDALDAFLGARRDERRAVRQSLTTADRAATLSHPEYGSLTVDWVIHQIAGHQIHHAQQLETIATR